MSVGRAPGGRSAVGVRERASVATGGGCWFNSSGPPKYKAMRSDDKMYFVKTGCDRKSLGELYENSRKDKKNIYIHNTRAWV